MIVRICRIGFVIVFLVGLSATRGFGQGLSATLSAGRVLYAPLASDIDTRNVLGTLRYDAPNGAWVYGTGAGPFRSGDPKWAAIGAGARLLPSAAAVRRLTAGADIDAHGFWHRDSLNGVTGSGFIAQAVPFIRVSGGLANFDVRGGWRGSALSHADVSTNRSVLETGVRAGYGGRFLRVEGDVRWLHAEEGTYPFVGGKLIYGGPAIQAWAELGKWTGSVLTDVVAAGGIGVALGSQTAIWGSVVEEAPDPLYWNAARRSVSFGLTRRLGGQTRATRLAVAVARSNTGQVALRLPVSEAPDDQLWVGGDFNDWQAVPMRRESSQWVLRLPLKAGVYHYAFRRHDGEWFVPDSVAGRRRDGMGGYHAVLVVD